MSSWILWHFFFLCTPTWFDINFIFISLAIWIYVDSRPLLNKLIWPHCLTDYDGFKFSALVSLLVWIEYKHFLNRRLSISVIFVSQFGNYWKLFFLYFNPNFVLLFEYFLIRPLYIAWLRGVKLMGVRGQLVIIE